MVSLKPHNYYRFSEIQKALVSIGKRELCEAFGNFDQVTVFYLDSWAKNDVYPDNGDPDYQEAPWQHNVEALIAALRSFGITDDEILVVSFD